MASYIEIFKSKLNWANVLQRTAPVPLDRTDLFSSLADATAYAKGDGSDSRGLGGTSFVGQVLTVYENGNVTVYVITEGEGGVKGLKEVGSPLSTVVVNDYSDALEYASPENAGRMVYVKTRTYSYEESGETIYTTTEPESGDYTTYDPGLYVVTGNSLQKIAQSSASGDIESDVAALDVRVSSTETAISLAGDDFETNV